MKVLFLILNYKTYQDTIRLTKELCSEGIQDKYILIVDNASPNNSYEEMKKELAARENVEVILSPENGGFAKGNNYGLKYAKKYNPEYVCIINNDIHFKIETIDRLCEWYEQLPNVCFISPLQLLPDGNPAIFGTLDVPTLRTDLRAYSPFLHKGNKYFENTDIKNVQHVGLIPGAFTFVKYSLFESLGFYDEETFLFCEERFIAFKSKRAGLKNYIILSETYIHEHSKTINSEASQKKQNQLILEGRCKYYLKYSKHPVFSVFTLKFAAMMSFLLSKAYRIVVRK